MSKRAIKALLAIPVFVLICIGVIIECVRDMIREEK